MVFAYGTGQHHPNHVGRQHRFAARPDSDTSHAKKKEQDIFRLELGYPTAESLEKPGGKKREDRKDDDAGPDEHQSLDCKRGENQAQYDNGSEVVHEAGSQNSFSEAGP